MKLPARFLLVITSLIAGCTSPSPTPKADFAPPPPVTTRPHPVATQPTTTTTTRPADVEPSTTDPRDTIPFLACDALTGRAPGTPGLQRAGDFLAAELHRIGVQPGPNQTNYFQPFEMAESASIASSTQFQINNQSQLLHKDFVPIAISAQSSYYGPVVFAGFGITTDPTEDVQYDDYAGIDVHKKVVLVIMKEPLNEKNSSRLAAPGQPWSNHALFAAKAKNAAQHGAAALLLVSPPASGGLDVVSPQNGVGGRIASIPVIQVTRRVADEMLARGGQADLKTLAAQIYADFKPRSAPLTRVEVAGTVVIEQKHVDVRNVIAALPGKGPNADEWVIVGAHYDHLGIGQLGHTLGKKNEVYHGADDNASGTATVLELADRLKHAPPLPRSVLFIFFTGEEEGLIGSDYFVHHPTIPLQNVVAMLNLDMVGRLKDNSLLVGGAATAPNFDSIVQSSIRGTHLVTSVALPDEGGRGGLGPSDHMSFALQKIPVLFLFTSMHPDYHRPTDTADKINYAGIDELVGVSQRIVDQLAAMPRQQYDAGSDSNAMAMMLGKGTAHRVILGIVPDDTAMDQNNGVAIAGVLPNGPAERAGFKPQDVLVAFNGKLLHNLSDLSQALDVAHAGDAVVVKVMRGGQEVELHAVLEGR